MPNGSGGAGSSMPSCLNRCSAVATLELSPFKILSFELVFIDLTPETSVDCPRFDLSRCPIDRCAVVKCSRLSYEISQAVFCITGFAKASLDQRFDSLLRGRSSHRSNASVPPGFDFDIRRQTSNVD